VNICCSSTLYLQPIVPRCFLLNSLFDFSGPPLVWLSFMVEITLWQSFMHMRWPELLWTPIISNFFHSLKSFIFMTMSVRTPNPTFYIPWLSSRAQIDIKIVLICLQNSKSIPMFHLVLCFACAVLCAYSWGKKICPETWIAIFIIHGCYWHVTPLVYFRICQ
jgi:hypothetical protein